MSEKLVTIIGMGNMGRRYSAILTWMGVDHNGVDIDDKWDINKKCIIATPTCTHIDCIKKAVTAGATQILCEKPITKNPDELRELMGLNARIYMVNNWKYCLLPLKILEPNQHIGFYNFYNTGPASDKSDMIQLEYLCKRLEVFRASPVFTACIDGFTVTREMIDRSYMYMIDDFLGSCKSLWTLHDAMEALLKCQS